MTDCVHDHAAFPSRWGPADRLGAGNLLTPQRRLAALQRVEEGRLFDLGHVIENGAAPPGRRTTPAHRWSVSK